MIEWMSGATGRALVAGAVAALVLSACASEVIDLPTATVEDSAGVGIVSYDLGGVDVPAWREVQAHDLEIGVIDGPAEYAFSTIGDVAVADDGSIVVTDRQALEVRVYDEAGGYLRALGREGGGPGEFTGSPWIAGVSGDTVFAFDSRSARVTAFSMTGDVLGDVSVRSDMIARALVVLRQDDGTYLTRSRWINPDEEVGFHELKLVLDSIVIGRLGPDGTFADTVAVGPDAPRARSILGSMTEGVRVNQAVPPFSPEASLRTVPSRQTGGSEAVYAYGATFDLAFFGPEGLVRRLRVHGVESGTTRADLQARQEEILVDDLGADGVTPELRRLYLDFIPETAPVVDEVLVSTTGEVWVSLFDHEDTNDTRWLVFDSVGDLRGSARTPAGLAVRWVGAESLVGVVTDDFDVQYVRRHPLRAPGGDG